MAKLKGPFITVKCAGTAQKVVDAGLVDSNMIVVMSPIEGVTQGRKAEIRIGSGAASFFMPAGVGAAANKARRLENPDPNFILTNFSGSYLGIFTITVINNGTALNFTPCSQSTAGSIFGTTGLKIDQDELALSTTVGKEHIKNMFFAKDKRFNIEFNTGEQIIVDKGFSKKGKAAFGEMMRLFGFGG